MGNNDRLAPFHVIYITLRVKRKWDAGSVANNDESELGRKYDAYMNTSMHFSVENEEKIMVSNNRVSKHFY
jgi:hypothetical protein